VTVCLFIFGICIYTNNVQCKPIFVLLIQSHTKFIEVKLPFLFSVEIFVLKLVRIEILTEATKITCVVRNMITYILVETYQTVWCHIPKGNTAIYLKWIP